MDKKSLVGFYLFIIILLFIIIGGYFSMSYFTQDSKVIEKKEIKKEKVDLRVDKTKDYIYYLDEKIIIEDEDIISRDIFINIEGLNNINESLKETNVNHKNSIKYKKDIENLDEEKIQFNNDEGIYSLSYREYEHFVSNEFISVLAKDYNFNIEVGAVPVSSLSFVINKDTGKIYTEEELLTMFGVTKEIIKEKITKRLNDTQVLSEETEIIKIDETIKDYSPYIIYINKNGKLAITFVVKSNKLNYNDNIELN